MNENKEMFCPKCKSLMRYGAGMKYCEKCTPQKRVEKRTPKLHKPEPEKVIISFIEPIYYDDTTLKVLKEFKGVPQPKSNIYERFLDWVMLSDEQFQENNSGRITYEHNIDWALSRLKKQGLADNPGEDGYWCATEKALRGCSD